MASFRMILLLRSLLLVMVLQLYDTKVVKASGGARVDLRNDVELRLQRRDLQVRRRGGGGGGRRMNRRNMTTCKIRQFGYLPLIKVLPLGIALDEEKELNPIPE